MSLLGNIAWLLCGGLVNALGYALGGLVCCLTIVGIPFGLQAFKLARVSLFPFGKTITAAPVGLLATLFNVLWLVCFGWAIACSHLAHAAVCAVTIIGIPLAVQHIKLIPVSLLPFGHSLESPQSS